MTDRHARWRVDDARLTQLTPGDARDIIVDGLTAAHCAMGHTRSGGVVRETSEREVRETVSASVRLLFDGLGLDWTEPSAGCVSAVIDHLDRNAHDWGLDTEATRQHLEEIRRLVDHLCRGLDN